MLKKWLLLCSLGLLLGACSTQHRTSIPQLSEQQLLDLMDEFSGSNATVSALLDQNADVVVYHAQDNADRPVASVLPLWDIGFISTKYPAGLNILDAGVSNVDVLFVDSVVQGAQRVFALLIKLVDNQGTTYYTGVSQANDYEFSDTTFTTWVNGAAGEQVTLITKDLSEDVKDELGDSIKLQVKITDTTGTFDAGSISTLHGYQFKN